MRKVFRDPSFWIVCLIVGVCGGVIVSMMITIILPPPDRLILFNCPLESLGEIPCDINETTLPAGEGATALVKLTCPHAPSELREESFDQLGPYVGLVSKKSGETFFGQLVVREAGESPLNLWVKSQQISQIGELNDALSASVPNVTTEESQGIPSEYRFLVPNAFEELLPILREKNLFGVVADNTLARQLIVRTQRLSGGGLILGNWSQRVLTGQGIVYLFLANDGNPWTKFVYRQDEDKGVRLPAWTGVINILTIDDQGEVSKELIGDIPGNQEGKVTTLMRDTGDLQDRLIGPVNSVTSTTDSTWFVVIELQNRPQQLKEGHVVEIIKFPGF